MSLQSTAAEVSEYTDVWKLDTDIDRALQLKGGMLSLPRNTVRRTEVLRQALLYQICFQCSVRTARTSTMQSDSQNRLGR